MKNISGSFSKLFLVSLLAGSMMLAGCGESNPTASTAIDKTNDSNTQQEVADSTASKYDVIGKVSPTIGQFDTNAKINITLTNTKNFGNFLEMTISFVVSSVSENRID